jgi:hypothetical protein
MPPSARQKPEDRSQKTEVRGQRSEDRGQKTEVRGQKTEGRRQPPSCSGPKNRLKNAILSEVAGAVIYSSRSVHTNSQGQEGPRLR